LFRRPLNPNLLTVTGALVSLGAAVLFALGWFALAALLMLAGGFFDLVDGVVARHQGISSRFGAFLDSTIDRAVDMALLLGLMVHFALSAEAGYVLLAGYALAAGVLVSYAKARAELEGPSIEVGLFERGERVALLALGGLLGWVVPALWIIALGSTITVVQRFALAYRELERIDAAERAGVGEHG